MTVFKGFLTLTKRNMGIVTMYFSIFLVIAIASIFVNTDNDANTYEAESLNITIIDNDGGELATGLRKYMSNYHTLVDLSDDKVTLQDNLYNRNTNYIITLPENFEEKLLNDGDKLDVFKVPDSTTGMYVDAQVDTYLNSVRMLYNSGYSVSKAVEMALDTASIETKVEIVNSNNNAGSVAKHSFFFQYFPYLCIALLCFVGGEIIIRFKSKDIKQRLLCSKVSGRSQNIQIFLGFLVISLALWGICMIVAMLLYRGDFINNSNFIYYLINSFIMVVVAMSLAFLVGIAVKKITLLTPVSNVVSLGMSFLCGVFVPLELLGDSVTKISRFLPVYWYETANDLLMHHSNFTSAQMTKLIQYFSIQIVFAVALLACALIVSRMGEQRL
ncbi:MAG: ABC transporter permease [Suipraeoptans sp.]